MTTDDYLLELRKSLKGMDHHAIDDIVADYTQYFADAKAAGRDESEVIASFGPAASQAALFADIKVPASRINESDQQDIGIFRTIIAVIGMGTLNALLVLPILLTVVMLVVTLWFGAAVTLFVGLSMLLFHVADLNLGQYIVIDIGGTVVESGPLLSVLGFGSLCMGLVWLWLNYHVTRWISRGVARYAQINLRIVTRKSTLTS
ncbi:DUF1700 domain-containing protein [Burkholderiaceae bacterium DAT-1]|nr:DUF1700 domain-containing protein [Burkholderiaceae bacterium DAT-1]